MKPNETDHIIDGAFDYDKIRRRARLPLICVYCRPKDYPEKFVARLWDASGSPEPLHLVAIADSLEDLRKAIPEFMTCIPRRPDDDPCIVETWI